MTDYQKHELQLLFRCFQLNFNVALKTVEFLGPVLITQGAFLLITSLYCIIQLHSVPQADFFFTVLGIVGLMVIVAFRTSLAMVMKITERSALFPKSYLRNEPGLREVDRKFYASCPPLIVRLGFLPLTRQTFLIIMNNVVVFSVINLLMASRQSYRYRKN
jgi:hypothetical protein